MCIRDRYQRRVHGSVKKSLEKNPLASKYMSSPSRKTSSSIASGMGKTRQDSRAGADINHTQETMLEKLLIDDKPKRPIPSQSEKKLFSFPDEIVSVKAMDPKGRLAPQVRPSPVSYTHLRAHETSLHLVCRLLLEKKKKKPTTNTAN
eukprot:TRINITY_DN22687_c0_g1_i5.p1 TRINITY_DN22687_c0_g1~~TRINITY_DN22687_c0_g1_i5.p1  ORF type:complete len:148 (+),score=41.66 TRINITY_DN22687_c0_g1_i5:182-625(+)